MSRSRRRQETSSGRQQNAQSYESRGGGQTGRGDRYDDQQRRFGNPQSRSGFGGAENWREENRGFGSDYDRESPYGQGRFETSRGMGQQNWSQGRFGSSQARETGWGQSGEPNYRNQDEESRYGRGYDESDFRYGEDYDRGMESEPGDEGYEPGDYSYSTGSRFGSQGRFGGYQGSPGQQSGYRSLNRLGRNQGSQSSWGMGGSQGYEQGRQPRDEQGRFESYRGGMSQGRFAGRGPQGYKRSDERITEDINEALTQDSDIDAINIQVEVQNGEITLKGTVPDRETKRRAEDVAESCSGVKEVQNQLRVKRQDESESESRRGEKGDDKRSHRQQIAS